MLPTSPMSFFLFSGGGGNCGARRSSQTWYRSHFFPNKQTILIPFQTNKQFSFLSKQTNNSHFFPNKQTIHISFQTNKQFSFLSKQTNNSHFFPNKQTILIS